MKIEDYEKISISDEISYPTYCELLAFVAAVVSKDYPCSPSDWINIDYASGKLRIDSEEGSVSYEIPSDETCSGRPEVF